MVKKVFLKENINYFIYIKIRKQIHSCFEKTKNMCLYFIQYLKTTFKSCHTRHIMQNKVTLKEVRKLLCYYNRGVTARITTQSIRSAVTPHLQCEVASNDHVPVTQGCQARCFYNTKHMLSALSYKHLFHFNLGGLILEELQFVPYVS